MGTDEQILTSFLDDDEELIDVWHVGTVGQGLHRPPLGPTATEEAVAITERRLLWFEDELRTIPLDDVDSLDRDVVEHTTAPRAVRLASVGLLLGLTATGIAVLFSSLPTVLALVPAGVGLAAFLTVLLAARQRGLSGSARSFPYLQVETRDGTTTLWGPDDALAEIATALERS